MSPMLRCNEVQEAELRVGSAFLCADSLPLHTQLLRGTSYFHTQLLRGASYWQLAPYHEATLGKTLLSSGPQGLTYELKECNQVFFPTASLM